MNDQPWAGSTTPPPTRPPVVHPSHLPTQHVKLTEVDVPFGDIFVLVWKVTWATIFVGIIVGIIVGAFWLLLHSGGWSA